jgi:hypothetical protein
VIDALEEPEDQPLPVLDAILEHCAGYPGRGNAKRWVAYFRRRRIPGAKLFDDGFTSKPQAAPPLPLTPFERPLEREAEVLQLSMQFHRARARRDARARRCGFRKFCGLGSGNSAAGNEVIVVSFEFQFGEMVRA